MASHLRDERDSRKLAAISVVAAGFGGDMPEELANELLDDIDYHYNKVKCRQIELIMPKLMKMVEGKMVAMVSRNRGQEEKNRKRNDEIETITKNSYYDTNITNIGYTLEV